MAATLLLLASAVPAGAADDPGPIAVGPTITALPEGDTADQPELLQDVFATGIADGSGCREVISTSDLLSMAQLVQLQQALGTEADATDALLGALGRYGDAPELAVLTVGRLGGKYVLTGRVLDTRSASVARSAQRTTASANDIPNLVNQLGRAVAKRVPCSDEWLGTVTVKRQASLSWSQQSEPGISAQVTGTFKEEIVYTFLPGNLVKVQITGSTDQTEIQHFVPWTDTIKTRIDNHGSSDEPGALDLSWVAAGTYMFDPGMARFTSRSKTDMSCAGQCPVNNDAVHLSDEVDSFTYGPQVTGQASSDATELRGSQTKPYEFGLGTAMYRGTETVTWELRQGE